MSRCKELSTCTPPFMELAITSSANDTLGLFVAKCFCYCGCAFKVGGSYQNEEYHCSSHHHRVETTTCHSEQVVANNGTQFFASELSSLFKSNRGKHIWCVSYHSSSNRAVKSFIHLRKPLEQEEHKELYSIRNLWAFYLYIGLCHT